MPDANPIYRNGKKMMQTTQLRYRTQIYKCRGGGGGGVDAL